MLEKIDLSKKIEKKEYKEKLDQISEQLSFLQRQCKEADIPVIVVFEGFSAAGKGTQINRFIQPLDPRGFLVHASSKVSEEERMRPFLWRYWTKTPAKGRMAIFERSWYRSVLSDRFDKLTPEAEIDNVFSDINSFEKQLTDDGTVIIKLFLYISKEEQKKRLKTLEASKETAWRVTHGDRKRNKEFESYLQINEEMLEKTDSEYAPWTIIEAIEKDYASIKIMSTVASILEHELTAKKERQNKEERSKHQEGCSSMIHKGLFETGVLSGIGLSRKIEKEVYKKKIDDLQRRISALHNDIYRLRIPMVLAFEGWDAAGKGGVIKRLTSHLDPRGYAVHPTASPNDIEKVHHYLWRFWNNIPKAGHIAIFDRTWYGRVMVERIEGFCSETEWRRAYQEINEMEEHMVNGGAIVLKFWLHIDKEEQERRFNERKDNPAKQWKITDEDWRNREKWDEYEKAVDEMLVRTSTTYAPWFIVEANSKYYARIKILEIVVNTMEDKIRCVLKSRDK